MADILVLSLPCLVEFSIWKFQGTELELKNTDNLKKIEISHTKSLIKLKIEKVNRLVSINISFASKLIYLSCLEEAHNLESLHLEKINSEIFSFINCLKQLKSLTFIESEGGCNIVFDLPCLEVLKGHVFTFTKIEIKNSHNLKHIEIRNGNNLTTFEVENVNSLVSLNICNAIRLRYMSGLEDALNLEIFNLVNPYSLEMENKKRKGRGRKLSFLKFYYFFSFFQNLKRLTIDRVEDNIDQLTLDMPCLSDFKALRVMITELEFKNSLKLKKIFLLKVKALRKIKVDETKNLESIKIYRSFRLKEGFSLANAFKLKEKDLNGYERLFT